MAAGTTAAALTAATLATPAEALTVGYRWKRSR
jgi:hypothetical protein